MATGARRAIPTLACVLWLAVFVVCAASPFTTNMISADGDFALHVKLGQLMVGEGGLLSNEPTSVLGAAKEPFVAHEWLTQLAFGAADAVCGLAGPVLLCAALMATVFALGFVLIRRSAVDVWPAFVVLALVILVARLHMVARPHLVTWLLGLLWVHRLEEFQRGSLSWRRWLAGSLGLIVLWTNLHGGFVLAFFLLGLFGLGNLAEAIRSKGLSRGRASLAFAQLFGSGVVLLAATAFNPFGFSLHAHVLELLATPQITIQREFLPPDLLAPEHVPSVVLLVGLLVLLTVGRQRPALWEWALAVGLGLAALKSARNVPLLAILCGPLLGRRVQVLLEETRGRVVEAIAASSKRIEAIDGANDGRVTVAVLAIALSVAVGKVHVAPVRFDPERLPVEMLAWMKSNQGEFDSLSLERADRALTPYDWAGYVAYELYPGVLTFGNSFADHYGAEAFAIYRRVLAQEGNWREVLRSRGVNLAIVRAGSPLAAALGADGSWNEWQTLGPAKLFVR